MVATLLKPLGADELVSNMPYTPALTGAGALPTNAVAGHYIVAPVTGDYTHGGVTYSLEKGQALRKKTTAWERAPELDIVNTNVYESVAGAIAKLEVDLLPNNTIISTRSYYGGWAIFNSAPVGGARYQVVHSADAASRPAELTGEVIHIGSTEAYLQLLPDQEIQAAQFGVKDEVGFDNTIYAQAAINTAAKYDRRIVQFEDGVFEITSLYTYTDGTVNPLMTVDPRGLITIQGRSRVGQREIRFETIDKSGTIFKSSVDGDIFNLSPRDGSLLSRDTVLKDFTIYSDATGWAINAEEVPGVQMINVSVGIGTATGSGINIISTWLTLLDRVHVTPYNGITQTVGANEYEGVGLMLGTHFAGAGVVRITDCLFDGMYSGVRTESTSDTMYSVQFQGVAIQDCIGPAVDLVGPIHINFDTCHWEQNKQQQVKSAHSASIITTSGMNFIIDGTDTAPYGTENTYPMFDLTDPLNYKLSNFFVYRPWNSLLKLTRSGNDPLLGSVDNIRFSVSNASNISAPIYMVDSSNKRDMPSIKNVTLVESANIKLYDKTRSIANQEDASISTLRAISSGELYTVTLTGSPFVWTTGVTGTVPGYAGKLKLLVNAFSAFDTPLHTVVEDGRTFRLIIDAASTSSVNIRRGGVEIVRGRAGDEIEMVSDYAAGAWVPRFISTDDRPVSVPSSSRYADDAAADTAGIVVGQIYEDTNGVFRARMV